MCQLAVEGSDVDVVGNFGASISLSSNADSKIFHRILGKHYSSKSDLLNAAPTAYLGFEFRQYTPTADGR